MPQKGLYNQIEYTITQPLVSDQIFNSLSEQEQNKILMSGSNLKNVNLDQIDMNNARCDVVSIEFRVKFQYSGSFFVQIQYTQQDQVFFTEPQYINVEPVMRAQEQQIKCNELSIVSVQSRSLGTIERWDKILINLAELGYNAIHFIPIQEYGQSNSHYSLKDQTSISNYYFKEMDDQSIYNLSQQEKVNIVKDTIDRMRNKHGILSIIDIVLNHTANNSEWLLDHPDAAYNTDDCPHLYSAWLLDHELKEFSDRYASGQNPYIRNEDDLKKVMNGIQSQVIQKLKLQEFFLFNIQKQCSDIENYIKEIVTKNKFQELLDRSKEKIQKWDKTVDFNSIWNDEIEGLGAGPSRMNVSFKNSEFLLYVYQKQNQNLSATISQFRGFMEKHNKQWVQKIDEFTKEAMKCMEGTIRYYKIEQKDSKITVKNRIVARYFDELPNQQQSKVAHNGWIGDAKPFMDFAMEGWHYLRRTINIWEDSVKLRYGSCPQDSAFLWDHMSKYVKDMAMVFDGFRLDNTHSTPIHVCQYLLNVARSENPNLFVMAELFTSSAEADAIFVKKLNLNGLVRELQNSYNAQQLGQYFHEITCQDSVIGQIEPYFEDLQGRQYQILYPRKPNNIIYDCTHDNPPFLEKFHTGSIALPMMGLNSMSDQAIATTWGVDILLKEQISVVDETKLYPEFNQQDILKFDNQDGQNSTERQSQNLMNDQQSKGQQPVDFNYTFRFKYRDTCQAFLAGSFTGWQKKKMNRLDDENWELSLNLPILADKKEYMYKFVVNDNQWITDQTKPKMKDGGNENNYIHQIPQSSNSTQKNAYQVSNKEATFQDIRYARKVMNRIHEECTRNKAEIFMDQLNAETIVVTRQFSLDYTDQYDAYVLISRFNFYNNNKPEYNKAFIELPGDLCEVVMASFLDIPSHAYHNYGKDPNLIYGINSQLQVTKNLDKFCKIEKGISGNQVLNFHYMPSTFTCVLKTRHIDLIKNQFTKVKALLGQKTETLSRELFSRTSLAGMNHLLYRCESEERDISNDVRGPYGFQKRGALKYAGIASFIHYLRQLKVKGRDMGDEIFDNMRQGNWLLDYTLERLTYMQDELVSCQQFMRKGFEYIKNLPPTFRPKYGSQVIEKIYNCVVKEYYTRRIQDQFLHEPDEPFLKYLGLGIIQMYASIPSATFQELKESMCAGLPHFATGYMRCWGRDTFIASRGLFNSNGFKTEAKQTIIYFARVMRHGLIPNLHDGGNNTRFNARDATWFFLQAIKDYIIQFEDGSEILKEMIALYFRDDNQQSHYQKQHEFPKTMSLLDLMNHILKAHAEGIEFKEWNAGHKIDQQMKDQGFHVKIYMDKETGFCIGGNQLNCGTWMDKMGSSEKTGNKGLPATPRDGAPIELVAMQFSILSFMNILYEKGLISQKGIQVHGELLPYQTWAGLILKNFEKSFWIPQSSSEDHKHIIDSKLVNRRGIYKDVFLSSHKYTDYQLRPNLCVAMALAPELFDKNHAVQCLKVIEKILVEKDCLGIKTLDPSDKNYNGNYVNSDDSQGWNYHQGPEWVWPLGFFIQAKVKFNYYESKKEAVNDMMSFLQAHQKHIERDPWESLPELTNAHGKECLDSCNAQAWSIATILDAVRDIYNFEQSN